MIKQSIDDLPFDTVVKLYQKKLNVERANNIRVRTRLLKKFPELFDVATFSHVENVVKDAVKASKSARFAKIIIYYDFINAKKVSGFPTH